MSAPAGAVNAWRCRECGAFTVAVHRDEGVTPMFLACRATPGCPGRAVSLGYPSGPRPASIPAPAWEWYRPDGKDLRRQNAAMRNHIANGGLALRPIKDGAR